MESEFNKKEMKDLFKAIAALETPDECKKFMRDLCTLSELRAMSERLEVAKQVRGNIPYRKIAQSTGSSTATITRVAHWLHHGAGGYDLVFHRL